MDHGARRIWPHFTRLRIAAGQTATAALFTLIALFAFANPPARAQTLDPAAVQDQRFSEAVASLKRGDYALALDQFGALAQEGHLAAQYDLGWMRAKGLGAPMDLVAAYQWFALVADAGQEKGRQSLNEIRGLMTPAQIAEGERRRRDFKAR